MMDSYCSGWCRFTLMASGVSTDLKQSILMWMLQTCTDPRQLRWEDCSPRHSAIMCIFTPMESAGIRYPPMSKFIKPPRVVCFTISINRVVARVRDPRSHKSGNSSSSVLSVRIGGSKLCYVTEEEKLNKSISFVFTLLRMTSETDQFRQINCTQFNE